MLTSSPQCRQTTAVSTPCPHECSNAAGGASIAHLSPQPKRAFLIAVNAVTRDPAYPREALAVDTTIRLIRHYTADHPSLLLGDPESATGVRTMLEAFIRLGWDKAITLAEELDELFL